jgi:hypothetical protein
MAQVTTDPTTDLTQRTPQQVFAHHGQALGAEDLDAILQDYAETACIVTPYGVTCGKEDIRTFFDLVVQVLPHAQWNGKTTFSDNVLLLEWTADSTGGSVSDGVETFVFQDGLIQDQTMHFTLVPKP